MGYVTRDYIHKSVRASAVLTNSYVAGTVLDQAQDYSRLILYVDFTIGSLTNGKVKVEFSADGTNYYQETYSSVTTTVSTESLGDHTFAATGKYRIVVPILDRYIRVSAIGTGTVTNSLLAVDAILGR